MARCPVLNKECIQAKCAWWMSLTMRDVRTQELWQEGKCVVTAAGPMLIDLIKNTGGVQAAVESNRNETIKRQDAFLSVIESKMLAGPKNAR